MNFNQIPRLTPINKFNKVLDELEQEYRYQNLDLDKAIIAWCNRLSIDLTFPRNSRNIPHTSEKVKKYVNQFLKNSSVIDFILEIYRTVLSVTDKNLTRGGGNLVFSFEDFPKIKFQNNIKETKKYMSTKSLLLIAFVLTGVGLLLFLLSPKEKTNNSRDREAYSSKRTNHNNSYLPRQSYREKYILALLINGNSNRELINSIKNSSHLKLEDSYQLYKATQGLWIGSETEFRNTKIKAIFDSRDRAFTESEYDVYFVRIELNEVNPGFKQNINQMDRIDAFQELANKAGQITVSERLLSKAYENTEFYSR